MVGNPKYWRALLNFGGKTLRKENFGGKVISLQYRVVNTTIEILLQYKIFIATKPQTFATNMTRGETAGHITTD